MALFPFLILALLFLVLRRSPSEYHLASSDEIDYWVESATLLKRGLLNPNTGFFGYSWQSHARVLNYGGHGLFSILPFVILGSFTSWQQSSMMLVNAVLVSASIVFAYFTSRSLTKTAVNICILFLFTSFSLYFFTGMLEALMFAGSMMLAALLPKLLGNEEYNKVVHRWFLGLSIAWSLFRLSNIVFLLPLMILEIVRLKRKHWQVFLKYGLIILTLVLASFLFSAPYPWGFLTDLFSSEEKILLLISHIFENLKLFFSFDQARMIEIVFRLGYVTWMLYLGASLIKPVAKSKKENSYFFTLVQLSILSSILLLNICFYDVYDLRDFRVLSPFLFFSFASTSFASFGGSRKKYLVGFIIGFLMLSTVLNLVQFRNLKANSVDPYFDDKRSVDLFKHILYDPQTTDRWQNTAYFDVSNYGWMDFNYYDPGIGLMLPISEDFETLNLDEVKTTLRAKYLITNRFTSLPYYEMIASDDNVYLFKRIPD